MCVPVITGTMSTNDVPQCDDVIVARGRHAEGCRLTAASAVVVGIKGFDDMLPDGKAAKRRDGPFSLRALSRQDALGTGTADAIELRGISQCGFMMMLMLRSQNGRLSMLTGPLGSHAIMVMPV